MTPVSDGRFRIPPNAPRRHFRDEMGGPGHQTAISRSSLDPRAAISRTPSGSGRWRRIASGAGAESQVSISSPVVRIAGIALGWIVATRVLVSVVKKANKSPETSPSFVFLTLVQFVQMPANAARGRSRPSANQTGDFFPSGLVSYSVNDVNGTMQRCEGQAKAANGATGHF